MTFSKEQLNEMLREAAKQGAEIALANHNANATGEWITQAEAAQLLQVSRATVWRLETKNVLKTNGKNGALKRYHRPTIEKVLNLSDPERENR